MGALALGPHDHELLDDWGRLLAEAFNEMPYLVGSAGEGGSYRDVDVRMIVPEDAGWLVEFPDVTETHQSLRLRTVNLAVTLWGRQVTGLPIDFQFQPAVEFHSYDGQKRSALSITRRAMAAAVKDRRSESES